MAQLAGTYVADQNNLEQDFPIIPAGDYRAVIENSDYVANKKGSGMILKLTWQIIEEGEHKGCKIFENLNLENENEQAVRIAQASLNSICMAAGLGAISDSTQLHGIPMTIKVAIQAPKDGYEAKNIVKKHTSASAAGTPAPAAVPPAQNAPAQGGAPKPTGAKPAWAK